MDHDTTCSCCGGDAVPGEMLGIKLAWCASEDDIANTKALMRDGCPELAGPEAEFYKSTGVDAIMNMDDLDAANVDAQIENDRIRSNLTEYGGVLLVGTWPC